LFDNVDYICFLCVAKLDPTRTLQEQGVVDGSVLRVTRNEATGASEDEAPDESPVW
jgi:hypothetical protein